MIPQSIVRRLATSQARGVRQLGLVNELMTFEPVTTRLEQYPVPGGQGAISYGRSYGQSRLQHASYLPLRRRLTEVGFILVASKDRSQVSLSFPENWEPLGKD